MKAASIIVGKELIRFTLLALALGFATSCATSAPGTNGSGDYAGLEKERETDEKSQASQQARFIKSSYNRW